MPQVVPLIASKSCDTVRTLRQLLQQAEAGQIDGIIFSCRYGLGQHEVGATGEYRKYPTTALGAAVLLMDGIKGLLSP